MHGEDPHDEPDEGADTEGAGTEEPHVDPEAAESSAAVLGHAADDEGSPGTEDDEGEDEEHEGLALGEVLAHLDGLVVFFFAAVAHSCLLFEIN